MKKLLPVLLALIGTAAGIGAGIFLAPVPQDHAAQEQESHDETEAAGHDGAAGASVETPRNEHQAEADHGADGHGAEAGDTEYVKLNNQFVVPVVEDSRVGALVVLSISLEVPTGSAAEIFEQEPKLRDAFLRALFDHANIGGFDGNFTQTARMDALRRVLFETGRNLLGGQLHDVLITDIARQDN